jgi:8-oxo-dGTP pyrophosphatase MutT (NUDIX family)
MEKVSYLSPSAGQLEVTVIRDSRPYVAITLDLGIPNFTVFSLKLPLIEDKPNSMSTLVAEAIHVLMDEVSAFMISMDYKEGVIVQLYSEVIGCYKGMSSETDSNKSKSPASKDPIVKSFEGSFRLPLAFINETYDKVVTAKKAGKVIQVGPKTRHIEFKYEKPNKPTMTDAQKVIKMYKTRSLKSQPNPLYIVVYDQTGKPYTTIPLNTGFKNKLLKVIYKKGAHSPEFSPSVKFNSDIEMKLTNVVGIPQDISVGKQEFKIEAYTGDDMALYSCHKGGWIVKFPDGRCVPFEFRPSIQRLRSTNYPVPSSYPRWKIIHEDEVEDKSKEVDAEGNEVNEADAEKQADNTDVLPTETPAEVDTVADTPMASPEGVKTSSDDFHQSLKAAIGAFDEEKTASAAPKLRRDNPGGEWLARKKQISIDDGRDQWGGYSRLGVVTGYYSGTVMVPVPLLAKVPGCRGEQSNPRLNALEGIKQVFQETGRLPQGHGGEDYAPFIMVDQDGKPWVNEGNHRIMAAKELGIEYLPVEVRYFNGGEEVEGEFSPSHIQQMHQDATQRGFSPEHYFNKKTAADAMRCSSCGHVLETGAQESCPECGEPVFWSSSNSGASGILPICSSTGRICLAWRSANVHKGNCWGVLGGAVKEGMTPELSARKEMEEEVGYKEMIKLFPAFVFTSGDFKYYNYLGLVNQEFGFHPTQSATWENDGLEWFSLEEVDEMMRMEPGMFHQGVIALFKNSRELIERMVEKSSNKQSERAK